jgi:hypothetical protein
MIAAKLAREGLLIWRARKKAWTSKGFFADLGCNASRLQLRRIIEAAIASARYVANSKVLCRNGSWPMLEEMSRIAVIEGPLPCHGEVHGVIGIELFALDQECPDAGVLDSSIFCIWLQRHVTRITLFAGRLPLQAPSINEDERQINSSLRVSSADTR